MSAPLLQSQSSLSRFQAHKSKALAQRKMDEDAFAAFALEQIARSRLGCLLESLGPLHARATQSFLSGQVTALIIERGKAVTLFDFEERRQETLTRRGLNAQLLEFATSARAQPGGPMIFPLLTYESFSPVGAAPEPHPIWPDVTAAWLVCSSSFHYDRRTQTLTGPEEPPTDIPWELAAQDTQPDGWRETEADYHDKIEVIRRDITDGVYYQANLSQRFVTGSTRDPIEVYRALRTRNPSPFMGIYRLDELMVLSGSPERLVSKSGEVISARPIAGTRPRGTDADSDAANREALLASPKERAEHLMLVDLIRNDLGRVAAGGSVHVEEFLTIESYSHVHHLVSQVNARLAADKTLSELIASLFPGGTITGAPKISCMHHLKDLETERRGPYTGSFGYLKPNGDLDLNILISTLIHAPGRYGLHAGGGIVADSMEQAEYQETHHKSAALLEALGIA